MRKWFLKCLAWILHWEQDLTQFIKHINSRTGSVALSPTTCCATYGFYFNFDSEQLIREGTKDGRLPVPWKTIFWSLVKCRRSSAPLYPTPSSAAMTAPLLAPATRRICFQIPASSRTCRYRGKQGSGLARRVGERFGPFPSANSAGRNLFRSTFCSLTLLLPNFVPFQLVAGGENMKVQTGMLNRLREVIKQTTFVPLQHTRNSKSSPVVLRSGSDLDPHPVQRHCRFQCSYTQTEKTHLPFSPK